IYDEDCLKASPKQHEQHRRAQAHGFVPNVYPVAEQEMPKGSAWRSFLSKHANKQRLQNFLMKEWTTYDHNVDWLFTMNLHCYDLASGECDSAFEAPTACEADTRAFYHAAKL